MTAQPGVGPSGAIRPAAVLDVGADGRIHRVTDDIHDLLGWRAADLVGRQLTAIIPVRFHEAHEEAFGRFVASGTLAHRGRALQLPALRSDGTETDVELVLSSMSDKGGRRTAVGVLRAAVPGANDLVARVRERLDDLIVADRPVGEVFESAIEPIAVEFDWAVGVLWAFDPWLERFMAMHVWERDPGAHPRFVEATRQARFVPGEAFSSELWTSGRPTWTSDLAGETEYRRAAQARADGLRSGIFVPVLSGGGPIGIVELVDARPRGIDTVAHRALAAVADELGRHLAERIRRETEAIQRQRLQLAMSAGRMGMWTFHVPTGQVVWDDVLEQVHGLAPGTFGGSFEAFASIIHADDRDGALAVVGAAVEERRAFDVSYRAVAPDGSIRWIDGSGSPVFDADGEMQVMTGIGRDVTAQVLDRELLHRRATTAALAADVGDALVGAGAIEQRLGRVVDAVVEHLGVAFARVWTLDDGDEVLRLVASAGIYRHLDGEHARIPVGSWKIGRIAASHRAHVTNDVLHDDEISDRAWARREEMRAFAGFPLLAQDRCVGVLAVFSRHELTADVQGVLSSITDSLAVAIAQHQEASRVRSLLVETQHQRELALERLRDRQHVAQVLQASLLPPELPAIDGLDVAAAYRAGVEDVGGDFYDLFPLGADQWGFMIGDVCGRGPEAARFTALARHTLRTVLLLGRSPAASLLALDQAIRAADTGGRFCTAVCGTVRVGGDDVGHVRIGVAGHPAPLVRRRDGTVEAIGATGPLLGVVPGARFGQHALELDVADAIVLYTDGVVEARGDDGWFGHDRLVEHLAADPASGATALTEGLVAAVTDFDRRRTLDDLAVLVLRRR